MEEVWKPALGLTPYYEVSNRGQVRSISHEVRGKGNSRYVKKGKILSQNSAGRYLIVMINCPIYKGTVYVHKMVLEASVSPRPTGFHACHNDGDKLNNTLENLRWDSPKNNAADKVKHGTHCRGERSPMAKLSPEDVLEIRAATCFQKITALKYGIKQITVSNIVTRKIWKHLP